MQGKERQIELASMLANQLSKLRNLYGVSQAHLGTLIGKSRQQISEIERGNAPLSWDTCLAIVMLACKKDRNKFISVMSKQFLLDINDWISGNCSSWDETGQTLPK